MKNEEVNLIEDNPIKLAIRRWGISKPKMTTKVDESEKDDDDDTQKVSDKKNYELYYWWNRLK